MNIRRLSLISMLLVGALFSLLWFRPSQTEPLGPQCGQYCVWRSAQLLGVPTTLRQVVHLLPPKNKGESLLELKQVLQRLGMEVDGWKTSNVADVDLADLPTPFIAAYDEHFVVVDEVNTLVRIFDGEGRRGFLRCEEFRQRWSGAGLELRPPRRRAGTDNGRPNIVLRELYLDAGEVEFGTQSIPFPVAIQNAGMRPLIIEDILTSCACTSTVKEGLSIPPGGQAEVAIEFRPGTLLGPFIKQCVVQSNDPQLPWWKCRLQETSCET